MAYSRVQKSAKHTSSQKKQSRIVPPPIDVQTQADSLPSTRLTVSSLPTKAQQDAIRRSLFEKWAGVGSEPGKSRNPQHTIEMSQHKNGQVNRVPAFTRFNETAAHVQAKAEAPQPESESEVLASAEMSTSAKTNQHQEASESLGTMGLPIQAKLTIGSPGDKYEQEADRLAAQVVSLLNAPAPQQSGQSPSVQREAVPEEEMELMMKPEISTIQREEVLEEEEELQMKSFAEHARSALVQLQPSEGGMAVAPDLEASIQQARGSGQPLADSIQQPMEQAFGADFSGVKVHTDAQSDQLNQSIQARAFTTGQDVFFRQGKYNPGSRGGQELLAHELTHVVQQNGGVLQMSQTSTKRVTRSSDKLVQRNTFKYERNDQRKGSLTITVSSKSITAQGTISDQDSQEQKQIKGSLNFHVDQNNPQRLVIGKIVSTPKRTGAGTVMVYHMAKYAQEEGMTLMGTDLSALEPGTPEFYRSLGLAPTREAAELVAEVANQHEQEGNPLTEKVVNNMLYAGGLDAPVEVVLRNITAQLARGKWQQLNSSYHTSLYNYVTRR